jgi:hypothetical protein
MKHFFPGLVILLFTGLPQCALANEPIMLHEQEIKAGLLYNFLKYTQWPETKTTQTQPISVCIFGEDPFQGSLHAMAERTVNQRKITLRFIESIRETETCHLLFINAQKKSRWPELKAFLAGKSVLTISDFQNFASSGGMIEFGRKDNHINAQINLQAVKAAKLQVEDHLLKLVTIVQDRDSR